MRGVGRSDEAIAAFDDVLAQYGSGAVSAEQAARALVNKGMLLGELQRTAEAVDVYDRVERQFGASSASAIAEAVAYALANKGELLSAQCRYAEAIHVFDDAVQRFAGIHNPKIEAKVASALMYRGVVLAALNRRAEAVEICDAVAQRYRASEAPEVKAEVATALVLKGNALLEMDPSSVDPAACAQDLHALLVILPGWDELPSRIALAVTGFSAHLEPAYALEQIESSPSAHLLFPLVTALQQESGLNPRVSHEVREVAQDVRNKLARTRTAGDKEKMAGDPLTAVETVAPVP